MPHISAFRALRYDPGHVGSLQGVIAPARPLDREKTNELYQRHPANAIRLIQNRDEPGDDQNARHERAGRFFRNWQREGVLQREPDPAIYAYHQQFVDEGRTLTRRGFICRTKIDHIDAVTMDDVTDAAAIQMAKTISQCEANVSPVVGIYDGDSNEPQQVLEDAIVGIAPIEATDAEDVLHRIWPITDVQLINRVISAISPRSMFVAAGLHAYEGARAYRSSRGADLAEHDAAQSVMTICFHAQDPGLIPASGHRLFAGFAPFDSENLKNRLSGHFDVRIAGEGSDLAEMIFDQIRIEDETSSIGFYCPADERWVVAKLNEQGRQAMDEIAPDQYAPWRYAGSNTLDRLVVESLLDVPADRDCRIVHHTEQLIESLDQQNDQAIPACGMAAITMPPSIDLMFELSKRSETISAQTLQLYPSSYSGLVFDPHEA